MLSIIFFILFMMVFGKMLGFAIKFTWGVFKIILFLVFLPLILVFMAMGGLIYLALPIILIVGIVSLFAKTA